jgi:hypothetical protein
MDPSTAIIAAVLYPTALVANPLDIKMEDNISTPWCNSMLNPKNRVDSLHHVQQPRWRIDGGEADGTRYFTIPDFALEKPPLRIDTYLPQLSSYPESLQDVLQTQSVMFTPSSRISCHSISAYITRALEIWSNQQQKFEMVYRGMPFGSRIVFNNITSDIKLLNIHIIPDFGIEHQWFSLQALKDLWNLPSSNWPDIISLEELHLIQQPHEAISLVKIPQRHSSELFVFKSVLRDIEYFYHELKVLLTLKPHPNIISRPVYIVTKECRFGGKTGVCGFILQYHRSGTLQNALLNLPSDTKTRLKCQLRWAKQITSAIQHVQTSTIGFYSNLKLINVVMSASGTGRDLDAVLIDFEQRSGFFSWSPPEIHYIHYLEHLATFSQSSTTRSHYTRMLQSYIPSWIPLDSKPRYSNPQHGYSFPWLVLSRAEQEAAQVFMLGKVLWCIFEGAGSMSCCISIESFREAPCDILFPSFRNTPMSIRDCIRKCTAGAPEWNGRWPGVVLRGNKLYPFEKTEADSEWVGTSREIQEAARTWWKEEIRHAEVFLGVRRRLRSGVVLEEELMKVLAFMKERPTLEEVAEALDKLSQELEDEV